MFDDILEGIVGDDNEGNNTNSFIEEDDSDIWENENIWVNRPEDVWTV